MGTKIYNLYPEKTTVSDSLGIGDKYLEQCVSETTEHLTPLLRSQKLIPFLEHILKYNSQMRGYMLVHLVTTVYCCEQSIKDNGILPEMPTDCDIDENELRKLILFYLTLRVNDGIDLSIVLEKMSARYSHLEEIEMLKMLFIACFIAIFDPDLEMYRKSNVNTMEQLLKMLMKRLGG